MRVEGVLVAAARSIDLFSCLSPGIRSSGKKADLVERLASSSAYHASLSKRSGARPNGVSAATKRAASAEVPERNDIALRLNI